MQTVCIFVQSCVDDMAHVGTDHQLTHRYKWKPITARSRETVNHWFQKMAEVTTVLVFFSPPSCLCS